MDAYYTRRATQQWQVAYMLEALLFKWPTPSAASSCCPIRGAWRLSRYETGCFLCRCRMDLILSGMVLGNP